jgi:two-component system sensor histidine kinase GlrK
MPQFINALIQKLRNIPVLSIITQRMTGPFRRMSLTKLFSLRNIIFIGFAIAVIPLFVAVLYAAFSMRETASLGKTLNQQVFEQTKTIRLVLQKSSDIERKARLFVLLSDPSLRQPYERQSYENARALFKQALDELLKLSVDNKIALRVNELEEKERLIYEQIIGSETEENLKLPVDEAFQGLREASNTLSREFESHVEQKFDGLHQQSESLEQGLLIKGAILLLVSVTFMATLLVMLSRSVRQLDTAIRKLGAGHRLDPIVVTGPSDLRYLGDRLEWLRTRLLELEDSKYRLMQTVAGEIEKPLEGIVELAAKLAEDADGEFDPQRLDTAMALSDYVQKLQTVSAELLRFSQINLNAQGGSKETVNMKALLESVIEDYQPRLQAKSLTVKALARPVEFSGIPGQLHAVVDHLVSNAVKYSPEGGEIRIMLRTSGVLVELEVEDEGPGFDPDECAKVFQPFFCGEAAKAEDAEGSGMGLAMVSEYVANHQGKVEIIESRQDQPGARIRVQLPLMDSA